MPPNPPNFVDTVNVNIELAGPEWRLQTTMTVPKEPIAPKEMLPLFFSFADAVVGAAAKGAQEGGKTISCKKGCGACCRQLVPLSETEARWIREVVDRLPPSRQTEIRERFAQAHSRLAESGLLEKLLEPERWKKGEGWSVAMSYFRLGIPCPFLENEACSIHPDRPVKCREYLVTSPAEHCRQPSAETVSTVDLPFQMWIAAARLDSTSPAERKIRWVPLILAMEWPKSSSEQPEPRPAHELLRQFFDNLTGKTAEKASASKEVVSALPVLD